MERFKIGKVYACDTCSLRINEFYHKNNSNAVEIRYEKDEPGNYGITLLRCEEIGEKTLFQEFYTSTMVASYAPLNCNVYTLTSENLEKTKREILDRELLYIKEEHIKDIDDTILEELSLELESNSVKDAMTKKVAASRKNLYAGYKEVYETLIGRAYNLAKAENVVRDFSKKLK